MIKQNNKQKPGKINSDKANHDSFNHDITPGANADNSSSLKHSFNNIAVDAPASFLQPKLTVNTPGDHYEKEADKMADNVTNKNISLADPGRITPVGQDKPAPAIADESLNNKLMSIRGHGNKLDAKTNSSMSANFGYDFTHVKIHTDTEATQMNHELNSKAFTLGNEIYFNKGEYKPGSEKGQRLIAHELTHVIQQNKGINTGVIQRDSPASNPSAPLTLQPESFDLRDNMSPLLASSLGSTEINGFSTGSSKIPKPGEDSLRYHAKQILYFLTKYPLGTVQISGHTDKVGKDGNNITLGQERANAARDFLLGEGIPTEIMVAESQGESSPIINTKDEVSEPRNRRVEVFFQVKSGLSSFGLPKLTPPGAGGTVSPPPPLNLDITKLPGLGEGRRIPYTDSSETDLWKRMKDVQDRIDKIPPAKDRSVRDVIIDAVMDKIRPITKKLPEIPLVGKPEDLIRKALEKGSESLCEETINLLNIDEAAKQALRESCKAAIQQKF